MHAACGPVFSWHVLLKLSRLKLLAGCAQSADQSGCQPELALSQGLKDVFLLTVSAMPSWRCKELLHAMLV